MTGFKLKLFNTYVPRSHSRLSDLRSRFKKCTGDSNAPSGLRTKGLDLVGWW